MAGAPKPGGGSQECPRDKGLQEAGFESVLRSKGSFFNKRIYHLCLCLLKLGIGGGEGLRAQCLGLFHPLSFGRRVYEKAPFL